MFAFAGEVLSGTVRAGMVFELPEAGHRSRLKVESVEIVSTVHGAKVGLVVNDARNGPGFLPGLGVGWTADLMEAGL